MEKIRECGSSVTYYGGRVVDTKSSELSPMTKAIMQEIRGGGTVGIAPTDCHQLIVDNEQPKSDDYLGVKFKLVKSNSCSSRLELIGATTKEESAEESVRSLVNRLETGSTNHQTTPRIIESKCIEKMTSTAEETSTEDPFTINSQLIETKADRLGPVDLINQVTVNNHISYTPATNNSSQISKVPRNRNVDLAFTMTPPSVIVAPSSTPIITKTINKPTKEKENIAKKAILIEHQTTFDDTKELFQTAFENIAKMEERSKQEAMGRTIGKSKIDLDSIDGHTLDGGSSSTTSDDERGSSNRNKWDVGGVMTTPIISTTMTTTQESKFNEKFFVTNDVKLKEKKKYDEMEFEEFEVFDPNSECYDSLNETK